jgi:Ala-tRNA(Pro) deacylase
MEMTILTQLTEFLDAHRVEYQIHSPPCPVAVQVAKAVMIRAGDECVLAVLPQSSEVSLDRLAKLTGNRRLRLATEFERRALFPGCDPGALPPFGKLYGLPVWIDASFAPDEDIAFHVGTHEQTVRMTYENFTRLVQPRIGAFHEGRRSADDA